MKKKIAVLGNGWAFDFTNAILEGAQEAFSNQKVDLYVFSCYKFHNPDASLNVTGYHIYDLIDFSRFDGVILQTNLFEDNDALIRVTAKIKAAGIPAVSLVNKIDGFHYIHINNTIGFEKLIEHLITEHNVKRIGYLGGIETDSQSHERYNAFLKMMEKHNLKLDKSIIFENSDWSLKFGYETGKELFKKNKIPDAIVCSNDPEAHGIIRAAMEYNIRIPEDLKIIGYDNAPLSSCIFPSLSTVTSDPKYMGKLAAQIILDKPDEIQDIELNSEPVIRHSCGCLNKEITDTQRQFPLRSQLIADEEERFLAHLRHTEDVFINDDSINLFWDDCQLFYKKRHQFEGEDFAIMLNQSFTKAFYLKEEKRSRVRDCQNYQVFVNLNKGKVVKPEVINISDLIPANLQSVENNIYFFLPLVYHLNFYGYYVGKNNLTLLFNKRGYPWTKNFANSIEKFREKTKYRLLSQKYLSLSTKDALSGVYNRNGLDMFGQELFDENRQSDFWTIIYFIDINNMKVINDRHGHLHGDLAVKVVAEEIKSSIPDKWIPVRYGGDEFVILGSSPEKNFDDCLGDINKKLKSYVEKMSLPYELSVSLGVAAVPPDTTASLAFEIDKVDEIMYMQKKEFHKARQ